MADNGRRPKFLPFEDLAVHFARFVVLDEVADLDGARIAPSLLFMADIDSRARRFFADLADVAAEGLDAIFGHCVDYPDDPSATDRIAYLRSHLIKTDTNYINTVG